MAAKKTKKGRGNSFLKTRIASIEKVIGRFENEVEKSSY